MGVAFRDPYEVLGVSRGASEEEIRQAYRRLARQYHPDINKDPDAEQRFKEVSEAYDILRDPEKRERYDRLGPNWKAGAGPGPEAGFEDVTMDFGEGEFGDLSDLFDGLFGRSGRRARGARRGGFDGFSARGADQEAVLELSLEEAARGGRRSISVGGRDFDVEIPPGVRDGQRIRLAGAGEAGLGGGPSGDLFLRIRLRPHPRFRLEGRDLYTELRVAPWEAALGASVEVHTLQGRANVRVPAGSSCGRRLRLRGEGMPNPGGTPGDLFAEVKIVVPKRLTQEERELFERLRDTSGFNPRRGR